MALKLAEQVGVIFLLMGIGVVCRKAGILSVGAAKEISNFVLIVVTPSMLVGVFQRDYDPSLAKPLGLMLFASVLFHLLAVGVTRLLYRKRTDHDAAVERMCAICSNCGFMGIPLMTAVMGDIGRLYAAVYIGVFNIYIWTHCVGMLTGNRRISLRKMLLNPGTIGAILGVGMFLLQIKLPLPVRETLNYLTNMNTPLPTIITGVFIADLSLRETLFDPRVYTAAFHRLVLLPLLLLGALCALRVSHWFPGAETAALAVIISSSCAAAVSCALLPAKFGAGMEHGGKLVAVTTLFSVITIPAVAAFSQFALSF